MTSNHKRLLILLCRNTLNGVFCVGLLGNESPPKADKNSREVFSAVLVHRSALLSDNKKQPLVIQKLFLFWNNFTGLF